MADVQSAGVNGYIPYLFGRRRIYTSTDTITAENVMEELNNALPFHVQNMMEEEYLYWYRRGMQPILSRTKEVRPEINNRVVENHAAEIVAFKNGYFLTEPAFYVSRNSEADERVKVLNEYLYRSGKQGADNAVVDWFHTVGRGALFIRSRDDDLFPVEVFALDPRSAFVVYSLAPDHHPVFAVNMVISDKQIHFDVFTGERIFRLYGTSTGRITTNYPTFTATASALEGDEPNPLRHIPIIEYDYNEVGMGSFEEAISLLDEINLVQSNRLDGIEQFIQSLAIAVNCEFDENTTANDIRQAGMIVLRSVGENRAEFKILSEQLDQAQTQVTLDNLYEQVLTICGMPGANRNGAKSTSDTGTAALARSGWYQADTVARNTRDLFIKSNRLFDEIFTDILRRKGLLDIKMTEFQLEIAHNETANVQSKAQAFSTLLASGLHPLLAMQKSGISNDPISDYAMSKPYIDMIIGNPEKANAADTDGNGEATIIEEDRFTGDNDTGGAV